MTPAAVPDPDPAEGPPGRGRPFSRQTEQAILEATTDLLAERGLARMSIEDVAARARAGKASIYRRWPSKGTLAFDAFVTRFLDRQPVPDTGRLGDDLRAALRGFVHEVDATVDGRTLKGLIAEVQRDPDLAETWRDRFVGPVRAQHRVIAERAMARGELRPDADIDLLLDLLYGPAYHRLLHGHRALDDDFVEGVAAAVAAAVAAGVV